MRGLRQAVRSLGRVERPRRWAVGAAVVLLVATTAAVALTATDRAPGVTTGRGWSVVIESLRPELSRAAAVTMGGEVLLLGGTGATPGTTDVTQGLALDATTGATRKLAAPPFDHALEQVGVQVIGAVVVVVGNPCLGPDPGSSAGACRTSTQLQAASYSADTDHWSPAPAPELAGRHLLTGVGTAGGSALFSVDRTGELLGYDPAVRRWSPAAHALRPDDVSVCSTAGTPAATTVRYLNQGGVSDTYPGELVDGASLTTGEVDYVQPQVRRLDPRAGWADPSTPTDGSSGVLYDPACTTRSVLLPAVPADGNPTTLWRLPTAPDGAPGRIAVPAAVDIAAGWPDHVVLDNQVVLWHVGTVYDSATDTWYSITPPSTQTTDLNCVANAADATHLIIRCHALPDGRDDEAAKPAVVLDLSVPAARR